jgi:hypothetical protein
MDNESKDFKEEQYEDDEYLENDLQLIELHKRLAMMKKERKKAEQDAGLLNNRLNLLKTEEDKAVKKIEVTKKKTQKLVINKEKTLEEKKQREEVNIII